MERREGRERKGKKGGEGREERRERRGEKGGEERRRGERRGGEESGERRGRRKEKGEESMGNPGIGPPRPSSIQNTLCAPNPFPPPQSLSRLQSRLMRTNCVINNPIRISLKASPTAGFSISASIIDNL